MTKRFLTVYFDGLCKLCSKEIELYQRLDRDGKINFVDICSPDFIAEEHGLDPIKVHKFFHVKRQDGQLVSGVDAFAEIWALLPEFRWLEKLSRISISRFIMKLGYRVFVCLRPYLPRNKADCSESPYCEIQSEKAS